MYNWRFKPFILFHLFALVLLASFFFEPTKQLWNLVDTASFAATQSFLQSHIINKLFWALANHNLADWFEDLCILTFFIIALHKTQKGDRLKVASQFIFSVLWITLTILFINRFICRDVLHLKRESPTLVFENVYRLSQEFPFMTIKDRSTKTFPGDHATTALLFALTYSFIAQKSLRKFALCYAVFLCLPRFVVGAHWLSDILVGTVSILLISLAWAFYTPCYKNGSLLIEKFLKSFNNKRYENQS